VTIARRRGPDWWLGAVTNTAGRTLELAFNFLPADQSFVADIYEDTPTKGVAKRTAPVDAKSTLTFELRPAAESPCASGPRRPRPPRLRRSPAADFRHGKATNGHSRCR